MVHVLFVHGTSVRRQRYDCLFQRVHEALAHGIGRNDVEVHPCYWGDQGAKLPNPPQSIPSYADTRCPPAPASDDPYDEALWAILLEIPKYELYMLKQRPMEAGDFKNPESGPDLWDKFCLLNIAKELLGPLGLTPERLTAARDMLAADFELEAIIQVATSPFADYRFALARAVLAQAAREAIAEDLLNRQGFLGARPERERALRVIVDQLGGPEGGLEWVRNCFAHVVTEVGQAVSPFALDLATEHLFLPHRGNLSDPLSHFFSDIFKYQANGHQIRGVICHSIMEVSKKADGEPIVLLAHSLGGVACVDSLVLHPKDIEGVTTLMTFGSQSPLFYEWDALVSLRYGQPLPEGFPAWFNVYDPRDPLAYKTEGVFPAADGRSGGIPEDIVVNSALSLDAAHNGYYSLPEFWDAVRQRLPA